MAYSFERINAINFYPETSCLSVIITNNSYDISDMNQNLTGSLLILNPKGTTQKLRNFLEEYRGLEAQPHPLPFLRKRLGAKRAHPKLQE